MRRVLSSCRAPPRPRAVIAPGKRIRPRPRLLTSAPGQGGADADDEYRVVFQRETPVLPRAAASGSVLQLAFAMAFSHAVGQGSYGTDVLIPSSAARLGIGAGVIVYAGVVFALAKTVTDGVPLRVDVNEATGVLRVFGMGVMWPQREPHMFPLQRVLASPAPGRSMESYTVLRVGRRVFYLDAEHATVHDAPFFGKLMLKKAVDAE